MTTQKEKWVARFYPSGDTVVIQDGFPKTIWLDLKGPVDDSRAKEHMAAHLIQFLSAPLKGAAPPWLADMHRAGPEILQGADGSSVIACGPLFCDLDGRWKQRETPKARAMRAALIDLLV